MIYVQVFSFSRSADFFFIRHHRPFLSLKTETAAPDGK